MRIVEVLWHDTCTLDAWDAGPDLREVLAKGPPVNRSVGYLLQEPSDKKPWMVMAAAYSDAHGEHSFAGKWFIPRACIVDVNELGESQDVSME